jgi:hypothetical protein
MYAAFIHNRQKSNCIATKTIRPICTSSYRTGSMTLTIIRCLCRVSSGRGMWKHCVHVSLASPTFLLISLKHFFCLLLSRNINYCHNWLFKLSLTIHFILKIIKIIIYSVIIWFITKKCEIWLIILYIRTNILNKMNDQTWCKKINDDNNLNLEGDNWPGVTMGNQVNVIYGTFIQDLQNSNCIATKTINLYALLDTGEGIWHWQFSCCLCRVLLGRDTWKHYVHMSLAPLLSFYISQPFSCLLLPSYLNLCLTIYFIHF